VLKMTRLYRWENSYEAAVLETNSSRLPARIKSAKTAINSRIEQMRKDHQGTPEEREATVCALAWIEVLEKERL
jgi:hypothetical protein